MTKLLFAIAFCFVGVGCSNLNLQKPTAVVTGMAVKGVDANGFTMNFDVDVSNPNAVALPLAAADYKLSLAGTNVLQGNAKPGGSIPAGGRTTVTLPVTMTYENLLAAEQGIVKSSDNVPCARRWAVAQRRLAAGGRFTRPASIQRHAAAQADPDRPTGPAPEPVGAEAGEGDVRRHLRPLT